MAYCRNCRAQLKTAQVCPVCGTQRIPTKKGLLRRKNLPLPDAKDGAGSLRAGLREGDRLSLALTGAVLLHTVLLLSGNVTGILTGDLRHLPSLITTPFNLLLPAGLLLLRKETTKEGAFAPGGIRFLMGYQIYGLVSLLASCINIVLPIVADESARIAALFEDGFWAGISIIVTAALFALSLFGVIFVAGFLWEWYGFRLCKKALLLVRENKRFRISRLYEAGFLIMGACSFIMAFTGDKSLLECLSSCAGGASLLLQYSLLLKIKKHI